MQVIGNKKAEVGAALTGLGLGLGHISTLVIVWVGFLVIAHTDD